MTYFVLKCWQTTTTEPSYTVLCENANDDGFEDIQALEKFHKHIRLQHGCTTFDITKLGIKIVF